MKRVVDFISWRGASEAVFRVLARRRGPRGHGALALSGQVREWGLGLGAQGRQRGRGPRRQSHRRRVTGSHALARAVASLPLASPASDKGPRKPSRVEGACKGRQQNGVLSGTSTLRQRGARTPESRGGPPFFPAQHQLHHCRKTMRKSRTPDGGHRGAEEAGGRPRRGEAAAGFNQHSLDSPAVGPAPRGALGRAAPPSPPWPHTWVWRLRRPWTGSGTFRPREGRAG